MTLCLLCALLLLSGCGQRLETEECCQITRVNDFQYDYAVTDRDGNVLLADEGVSRAPEIEVVSEDVVKVSIQTGTGISTRWTIYCDVDKGRVSETFHCVLGQWEGNAAFVDYEDGTHSIVVRDIFDSGLFYEQTVLEDVSPTADPVVEFEVSDGTVTVAYLTGDDYSEKEITINMK